MDIKKLLIFLCKNKGKESAEIFHTRNIKPGTHNMRLAKNITIIKRIKLETCQLC